MKINEADWKERLAVSIDEQDGDICRVLWLSVIMQGLSDAFSESQHYPFKQRREEALRWFAAKEGSGSDFAMTCDLAGIDFEMAKERINKFINNELDVIDFRCFRKGNLDELPTKSRSYFSKKAKEKELRNRMRHSSPTISPNTFRKLSRSATLLNKPITHLTEQAA